ncbi:MAG TPA: GAF domain-containing SpoIIE family protein phosphatase, partial [Candidatus Dormibacteraeota bacterium]|nr:GAF domain-containing SpoIIE family protein phosphatase [Candidatus Dormibacteraeota bacterium]
IGLRLAPYYRLNGVLPFLSVYLSPYFCVVLGFWVAAARPRDPRAWFLLLLLLGLSCFLNSRVESWGPVLRDYGTAYRLLMLNSLPVWLLWLGVYFPERFPRRGRWRVWYWLAWGVSTALAVTTVMNIAAALGALENLPATWTLRRMEVQVVRFNWAYYFGLAMFPVCMLVKWRTATSLDSRRRLRLLSLGSAVSLGPLLFLDIVAFAMHREVELYFPPWLYGGAYALRFLFPITLAYAIVVQRAMDVRVVLRQGIQYALARRGVILLQALVTAVAIYAGASIAIQKLPRTPAILASVVALGIVVASVVGRGAQPLRLWIDRRFFRAAYNAEQILTELSENVRTIVEIEPLLETVSRRIAESLHVSRLAVFLDGRGQFRPAYALGFAEGPVPDFHETDGTIQQLGRERQPASVHLDDDKSWVNNDGRVNPEERAHLATLNSELLLPLTAKDELLGFISLGPKLSEEPYTASDVRVLKSVAAQTGLALEVARLTNAITEEVAQRERLNREIEIAREVQEHLFPTTMPTIAGLDYRGRCRPALIVGGDYFDFLALPDGKLGIAIGDVSGKGISAALVMASLQASLRSQVRLGQRDLAELVACINGLIYEASSAERYATFFYSEYEPATRTLSYVNAGHNPPIVFRHTSGRPVFERLESGGTVVGLLPHCLYQQGRFEMRPGDALVAFTDGVSEAMNADGELWGEERLMATLAKCDDLAASEVLDRIIAAVDQFAAGAKQNDDMTLIVARVVH